MADDLPDTSYAILGLLTFGETSGYDLGKLIAESIAHFFFKPAKSQIYAELRRLVAHGYAAEREVAQRDRPDKRLYAITARGRKALSSWLDESSAGSETLRCPVALRVFFGGLMDRDTLIEEVRGHQRAARAQLARFQELERQIAGCPELFFPSLVLRRGLAHERASIRWAAEVLKELERPDDGEPAP